MQVNKVYKTRLAEVKILEETSDGFFRAIIVRSVLGTRVQGVPVLYHSNGNTCMCDISIAHPMYGELIYLGLDIEGEIK